MDVLEKYDNLDNCEDNEKITDKEETDDQPIEPFDPRKVDILQQNMVINNIVSRLENDEIILDPEYQRKENLWGITEQSRLIESLIIRIPLPSFYFDYDAVHDKYTVVDGLQRLCAIRNFMVLKDGDKNKLRLQNLEYLSDYEGKTYEELPSNIQRRIKEETIVAFVIRQGTPDKVRNSIFRRINTGGKVLSAAEIKNAIYRGDVAQFLKRCAETLEFRNATRASIPGTRMLDREFVNRFVAFYLMNDKFDGYNENLEDSLVNALEKLKLMSTEQLNELYGKFIQAMVMSEKIFGRNAFRKILVQNNKDTLDGEHIRFGVINKPLFECVAVSLARLDSAQCSVLEMKKDLFWKEYTKLLSGNQDFIDAISSGTARISSVKMRYLRFKELLRKVIES